MKTYTFYNRDGKWYINLPEYLAQGGTEEECEMVSGADTWLDQLCQGKDKINIKLNSSFTEGWDKLYKIDEDDFGATYLIESFPIWLCPVTKFVFGDFPKEIYYKVVS